MRQNTFLGAACLPPLPASWTPTAGVVRASRASGKGQEQKLRKTQACGLIKNEEGDPKVPTGQAGKTASENKGLQFRLEEVNGLGLPSAQCPQAAVLSRSPSRNPSAVGALCIHAARPRPPWGRSQPRGSVTKTTGIVAEVQNEHANTE